MTRLTLALAVWISLVSVVSASLTPRKERSPFSKEISQVLTCSFLSEAPEQPTGAEAKSEFILTHRTEVLLNGKRCKYEEVPDHARIVKMEVAEDEKTVLRIHFRTGK